MAKFYSLQCNFTAGSLSKSAQGRTDLTKYGNAVDECINYVITKRGGILPRAGTVYVADLKTQDERAILIPFVFATDNAFMIEAGQEYFRFFKDGAPILVDDAPYEITTPYQIEDLENLRFAQHQNKMIFTHPDYRQHQLTRVTDELWRMSEIIFNYPAMEEQGVKPDTTLDLSDITGTITLTAGMQTFMESDVGRQLGAGAGLCRISAYTSSTEVDADVLIEFDTDSYVSGEWVLLNSPICKIISSSKSPGEEDVNLDLRVAGGVSDIDGWRDGTWSFSNIGDYVAMSGGLLLITSVVNAHRAKATVLRELTEDDDPTTPNAPNPAWGGGWQIVSDEWTDDLGYPSVCGVYEGRLILGGSEAYPNRVWGSKVGNYLDFWGGVEDDNPFEFDVLSGRYDKVSGIDSAKNLIVRTTGSEYAVNGRNDGPVAPANTSIKLQSSYGSDSTRSTPMESGFSFVQRSGRSVFYYGYDYNVQGFDGDDLTDLNDDMTKYGVVSLTFEQDPYQHLYCVVNDSDGTPSDIALLCIDRKQEVIGWTRLVGGDGTRFIYVATIPVQTTDQTWCIARLNGRLCIQYFDYDVSFDGYIKIEGDAQTSWTGLDHLKNSVVTVLLDGQPYKGLTVDNTGTLVTPYEGDVLETGFFFESSCTLLPVEVMLDGSVQGRQASVNEILVKMVDTQTLNIYTNIDQQIPFRAFGLNLLDQPIDPFTGFKKIEATGVGPNLTSITLKRESPLKQHILCVNRMVTVN